jgi:hypothetical protein
MATISGMTCRLRFTILIIEPGMPLVVFLFSYKSFIVKTGAMVAEPNEGENFVSDPREYHPVRQPDFVVVLR